MLAAALLVRTSRNCITFPLLFWFYMHTVVYKLVGAVFRAKKIFPGLEGTFIHRAPMCTGINSSCHSLQAITGKVGASLMKAPFNFSRSNAASL